MKKIIIIFFISISLIIITPIIITNNNNNNSEWNTISKQINYFKKENLNRYENYKKRNPKKSINQIIIEVNIGLDKPFYTSIIPVNNIDTPYILVNKYNYLDSNYTPKGLKNIDNTKLVNYAAIAFNEMKKDALEKKLNIIAISGYRSFNYQENLYRKYANIDGIKKADTYSARAGHSEHQTGLAVDISNGIKPYTQFEETEEFKWIIKNSYKYGFILRYPKNKEHITGYTYESWHYRYVGVDIATYIQKNNITFDEYYVMFIDK